eukprot:PhF_6_TR23978/c0_g1_i1/m.33576
MSTELWLLQRELRKLEEDDSKVNTTTKEPSSTSTENNKSEKKTSNFIEQQNQISQYELWLSRRELERLEKEEETSMRAVALTRLLHEQITTLETQHDSLVEALAIIETKERATMEEIISTTIMAYEKKEEQKRRNAARQKAIDEDIKHEEMMKEIEAERRWLEVHRMKERRKREEIKNRAAEAIERVEMDRLLAERDMKRREELECEFYKEFDARLGKQGVKQFYM